MAYCNVLDTSNLDGMSLREIQARGPNKYAQKAMEDKHGHAEEMRVAARLSKSRFYL